MSAFTTALAAVGSAAPTGSLIAAVPPASARVSTASSGTGLDQVTGFGSNPGSLSMYCPTGAPTTW